MQFEITYRFKTTNWLAFKRFWARNETVALVCFWTWARSEGLADEVEFVRVDEKFELPVA